MHSTTKETIIVWKELVVIYLILKNEQNKNLLVFIYLYVTIFIHKEFIDDSCENTANNSRIEKCYVGYLKVINF